MGKRRCVASGACAAVVMTAALISTAEEIETDRDAFTFAPTTVAVGRTILEMSYSFIDNRVGPEAHSVPELLARFGMGERIELRLGANSGRHRLIARLLHERRHRLAAVMSWPMNRLTAPAAA